jgi:hypothetical protein
MVLVSFCVNLASQQLIKKVGVGGFLFCRLFQAGGRLLFNLAEPQLMGSVRADGRVAGCSSRFDLLSSAAIVQS